MVSVILGRPTKSVGCVWWGEGNALSHFWTFWTCRLSRSNMLDPDKARSGRASRIAGRVSSQMLVDVLLRVWGLGWISC